MLSKLSSKVFTSFPHGDWEVEDIDFVVVVIPVARGSFDFCVHIRFGRSITFPIGLRGRHLHLPFFVWETLEQDIACLALLGGAGAMIGFLGRHSGHKSAWWAMWRNSRMVPGTRRSG